MANEVQISINFRADKNGAGISTNKQFKDNCSGPMISRTQELTSTYEALDTGDVNGPSQIVISNLSATDNVVLSKTTSDADSYCQVGPGKTMIFRPNTSTYVKADVSSATIQVLSTEE